MKTLNKFVMLVAVAALFACPSFALTEKVGDYTWTYMTSSWTDNEGKVVVEATLGDGTNACVSPAPVGRITLPKTLGGYRVTGLADYAFKGCSELSEVQIAENLEWTDEKAFNGATALESIVVLNLNEYFFSYGGVLYAGDWDGAELVRVPEAYAKPDFTGLAKPTVEYVWPDAFRDCVNIKTVSVNAYSMWGLEGATFAGCSSFEAFVWENVVVYDGEKEWYPSCVRDGVLYDGECGLLRWPTAKPFTGIPDGVYNLYDFAFAGNATVTTVTISKPPKNACSEEWYVDFESSAFMDCVNLKTIICESWAETYVLWDLEESKDETGVHIEKVVYPWQPAIAEEWEGYDWVDSTGGVWHVTGLIADFKDDFPASKVVFEKAQDPNLGVTNMTFPYTTRWIDLGEYDFEAYADTLTTLTFDGPAPEGLREILEICTNVTKIVYSANPIYRDHDGGEWMGWKTAMAEIAQYFPDRVFTFEQGAVPIEPQFYSESAGCEGDLSAFYGEDDVVYPCVWPAPKGELVIPNDFYYAEGEAFKGLTDITSLTLPVGFEFSEEALNSLGSCTNLAEINMSRWYEYNGEEWEYGYGFYSVEGILYDEDGNVACVPPAWAGTELVLSSWAWENALVGCRNIQTLTVYDPEMLFELNLTGCEGLTAFAKASTCKYCGDDDNYGWDEYQIVDGALYEDCGDGFLALVLWPSAKKPIALAKGTVEVYSDAFRFVTNPQSVTEFEIPLVDYGDGDVENCYVDLWELASEYGFTGIRKLVFHGYPEIDSSILEVVSNLTEVVYPSHPRYAAEWADVIADFTAAGSFVTFTPFTPFEAEYVCDLEVWDEDDHGNILYGECWLGDGVLPYAWPLLKGAYEVPDQFKSCRVVGAYANAFVDMTELTELTFPAEFRELDAYSREKIIGSMFDATGDEAGTIEVLLSKKSGYASVKILANTGDRLYGGGYVEFESLDGGWNATLSTYMSYDGILNVQIGSDGKITGLYQIGFTGIEYEIRGEQPIAIVSYSPFAGCTKLAKLTFNGRVPEGLAEALEQTPSVKEVCYRGAPWCGWNEFIGEFESEHPDADVAFTMLPYNEEDGLFWNIEWEGYNCGCLYGCETWLDGECQAQLIPGIWPVPSGEVSVPNGVAYIGENSFLGCSNITSVVMPDTLESMEAGEWLPGEWIWDEEAQTSVFVANGEPAVVYSPFVGCTKLAKLAFNGRVPEGLAEVLALTPSIREVVYPATPWFAKDWELFIADFMAEYPDSAVTFTKAGVPTEQTFNYVLDVWDEDDEGNVIRGECWLGENTYPVGSARPYAWPSLSGVYEVPEKIDNCSVVGAYENAFADMTELTELVFPASFYELHAGEWLPGEWIWDEETQTSVFVAGGEPAVAYSPFMGCTKLAKLTFKGSCPYGLAAALEQTPSIKEVVYPGTPWKLDDWNEFIADFTASHDGVTFTAATSQETLWNIEWEYDDCGNKYGYLYGKVWEEGSDPVTRVGIPGVWPVPTSGELVVPEGVVEISDGAFFGCAGVTKLVLPRTLEYMDEGVLSDLPDLQQVVVASGERDSYYRADKSGLLYDGENYLVFCPPGIQGTVVLGYGCWGVYEDAFAGCTNVTEIVLSGYKEIYGEVFAHCSALEKVTADVTAYGLAYAFGADQRVALTLRPERWWICDHCVDDSECPCGEDVCDETCGCPGVWYMADGFVEELLFEDADWITSLKVEEGVWGIAEGAFCDCSNLMEVEMPASLDWMGEGVFAGCSSLTKVCYYGNAPYGCEGLYEGTPTDLVSYVKYGTTGWNGYEGDDTLPAPAVWPVWAWDDEMEVAKDEAARAVVQATAEINYYVDGTLYDTAATYVGTAPELPEIEKEGCTFGGWFVDEAMTVAASQGDVIAAFGDARSLYGAFVPNQYTLTFNSAGGSEVAPITQDYGTVVTAPAAPTRVGYTFGGWLPAVPATVPASNVTLVAQWEINRYKVTFGKNGGTGGDNYVTATYGMAMPTPRTAPTRAGYIFDGYWNTTKDGGKQYYDANMKSVSVWDKTSDATLWAKWEKAVSVKVTFGKNGGTGGDSYVTATYGSPMPTPRTAPTLSGWTFAGYWDSVALDEKGNPKGKQYYNGSMKSASSWDKTSAATLWAKWTNKVTLGKNGGTGGDSYVTCTKGQPMPKRTMPTKSGYAFAGYWTTTGTGGVKYYNADGTSAHTWDKSGNVTLWAKWEKAVSVKVTFGKNGGTGGDNYVTCTTGKPMPTPRTAPKRTGWTFDGYWDTLAQDANGNPKGKQYYDKDMKSVRIWDKPSAVTLWAKWTVRVKLGKNGGTGGDDEVVVTYNQPFPKKAMPKRTGYTFGGYFVSASSKTGQCYNADGTGTSSMKWTTGGTPTIWALWTKTGSNVVQPTVAAPVAATTRVVAVPAVAEVEGPIPAGLYSGVLADGSGAFWLMLDEPEEGYDRTAYLYVASEVGALTAECTVEESDGILILTTEDGETFAVDPAAGSASRI